MSMVTRCTCVARPTWSSNARRGLWLVLASVVPLFSGCTDPNSEYRTTPTTFLTLYLDPRDCLTCFVQIGRWTVAARHAPDSVQIVLTRIPTSSQQVSLSLARVRSDAVLDRKEAGARHGSRVAVREPGSSGVTWYAVVSPVVDSLLERYQ